MQYPQTKSKFNILDELDGALRRKAAERQRSRDTSNLRKNTAIAFDYKKSKDFWSITNRPPTQEKPDPTRKKSIKKETSTQKGSSKNLFHNQGLNKVDVKESRTKKSTINKRLEKLGSLIGYVISSAEKAIKYVNLENFEAEFAYKLFKSDKENVLNEMNIIMDLALIQETPLPNQIQTHTHISNENILKGEITELKKILHKMQSDISEVKDERTQLLSENKVLKGRLNIDDKHDHQNTRTKDKEIGNLLKEIHEVDELKKLEKHKEILLKHNLFLKEKEIDKLKRIIRSVTPSDVIQKYFQTVDKETKFNLLIFSNFENSKKRAELEQILKALEVERTHFERQIDDLQAQPKDNDTIRRFIRERLRPELNLNLNSDLSEVEIMDKCLEKLRHGSTKSNNNTRIETLEHELAQVLSEKVAMENKMELLKSHKPKHNSVPPEVAEQLQLMKENIDQIYEELLQICNKNGLIEETSGEINIEELLTQISSSIPINRKKLREYGESLQLAQQKFTRLNQRHEAVVDENQRLSNAVQLLQLEKEGQKKLQDLEKRNSELRSKVESHEREKLFLEERISDIKSKMKDLKEDNNQKERKLESLEEVIVANDRDRTSLFKEQQQSLNNLERVTTQNNKYKNQLQEQLLLMDQLREQVEDFKRNQKSKVEMQDAYEYEVTSLKEMISTRNEEAKEFLQMIERLQSKANTMALELAEAQRSREESESLLEQNITKSQQQISRIRQESKATIEVLTSESRLLEEQLSQARSTTQNYIEVISNLELKLEQSTFALQQVEGEALQHTNRIEQLTRESNTEREKEEMAKQRYQQEINQMCAEIHQLREEAEGARSDGFRINQLQERIKEFEDSMRTLEDTLQEKERVIEEKERIIGEMDEAIRLGETSIGEKERSLQQLRMTLQEKQQAIQESRKEDGSVDRSQSREEQINQMMEQVNFKQNSIRDQEEQLDAQQKQLEINERQLKVQKKVALNRQNELAQREQEITARETEIQKRVQFLNAEEQDIRRNLEEMSSRFDILTQKEQHLKEAQEVTNTQLKQLDDLKSQLEETQQQLYEEEQKCRQITHNYTLIQQQIQQLHSQTQNVQESPPDHASEVQDDPEEQQLQSKVKELQEQVSVLASREFEYVRRIEEMRNNMIEESRQIVDLGIQAYVEDSIREPSPEAHPDHRFENQRQELNKLHKQVSNFGERERSLNEIIEEKEAQLQNLKKETQMSIGHIRLMEENMDYLNERVDEGRKGFEKPLIISRNASDRQMAGENEMEGEENGAMGEYLGSQRENVLLEEISTLKESIEFLRGQVVENRNKYVHLKEEKETEVLKYESQLEDQLRTIDNLKTQSAINSQISPRDSLTKLNEELLAANANYEKTVEEKDQEIRKYKEELLSFDAILKSIRSDQNKHTHEDEEKREKELELEQTLKQEIQDLKEELKEMSNNYSESQLQKEKESQQLQSEIDGLKGWIQHNSLDARVTQLTHEIQELKIEYQQFKAHKEEESQENQQTIHSHLLIIEDMKKNSLKHQEAEDLISNLKGELEEYKNSYARLEAVKLEETQHLKSELMNYSNIVYDIKANREEESEGLVERVAERDKIILSLESQMESLIKQLRSQEDREERQNQQRQQGLAQDNRNLREEIRQLAAAMGSAEEDVRYLKEIIQQMERNLNKSEETVALTKSTIFQVTSQLNDKKRQIYELQQDIVSGNSFHTRQLETLTSALERNTIQIQHLRHQNQQLSRYTQEIENAEQMQRMEIESCKYLIKKVIKLGLGFEDLEGEEVERMVEISLERVRERRDSKILDYSQSHSLEDTFNGPRKQYPIEPEKNRETNILENEKREETLVVNFDDFTNQAEQKSGFSEVQVNNLTSQQPSPGRPDYQKILETSQPLPSEEEFEDPNKSATQRQQENIQTVKSLPEDEESSLSAGIAINPQEMSYEHKNNQHMPPSTSDLLNSYLPQDHTPSQPTKIAEQSWSIVVPSPNVSFTQHLAATSVPIAFERALQTLILYQDVEGLQQFTLLSTHKYTYKEEYYPALEDREDSGWWKEQAEKPVEPEEPFIVEYEQDEEESEFQDFSTFYHQEPTGN